MGKSYQSSAELAQSIFSKAAEGRRLAEKRKRQQRQLAPVADPFPFARLPFDVQEMVLRFLPASEIGMCCAVCKAWGHVYQGAVASIFAQVVGVARGRSRLMRHAELQLIHRLRNTHEKHTAVEMALWAAFNGYSDYVLRLISGPRAVISANTSGSEDWDGATLLHVACRQGNVKLARALLDHGANPAQATRTKQTSLILACEYGFAGVVELLLNQCGRALNVNAVDNTGRSALFTAAEKGHTEIVTLLVDWGEMIQQETGEAEPILDLDLGTAEKGSPLCVACSKGQSKIARRLLEAAVHVNVTTEDGRTALFCAVERGALTTTKIILEKRPPVTATEMAEMFFKAAPHHGMQAAQQRADTETEMLNVHPSAAGALVDFASNTGKTPVFVAAERGNAPLLQVLIDARANTNKPTFLNKTPLYAATENGHTDVVKQLLEHCTREDVLRQTNFGTTAPFMAQRNGHMQIKALLSDFCTEKLTVEKARKRKSRRKQTDAMNRLIGKAKASPAAPQRKAVASPERSPAADEAQDKASKVDRDVAKSRQAVDTLLADLEKLELEVEGIAMQPSSAGAQGRRTNDASAEAQSQPPPESPDAGHEEDVSAGEEKEGEVPAEMVVEEDAPLDCGDDASPSPEVDEPPKAAANDAHDDGGGTGEGESKALPSREQLRRERAAYFAQRFAAAAPAADAAGPDERDGDSEICGPSGERAQRLIPKKEKEVLAARKWSETFIGARGDEDSATEGEPDEAKQEAEDATRPASQDGLTLKGIRASLLKFSSQTSSYKMSEDVFQQSFGEDCPAQEARRIFDLVRGKKAVANAWDMFVASTLSTPAEADAKLAFCFGLFDSKSEGLLEVDVARTMLRCCTKVVGRLAEVNNRPGGREDLDAALSDLLKSGKQALVERNAFVRWAQGSQHGKRIFGPCLKS